MQRRRPPPAADTGRSCWGHGQQDTSAAWGTKWTLGTATRRSEAASFFELRLPLWAHQGRVAPCLQRRRPPPAADAGRSRWGRGLQDASAAQGAKQTQGAATRTGVSGVQRMRGARRNAPFVLWPSGANSPLFHMEQFIFRPPQWECARCTRCSRPSLPGGRWRAHRCPSSGGWHGQ